MNIRHKLLALADAVSGTELSGPVLDDQGQLLLPAGTVLSEATLRSLQRRGIEAVQVVDDQVSQVAVEVEVARHRARLAVLFRHYPAINGKDIAGQLLDGVPAGANLLLRGMAAYRLGRKP